MSEQKPAPFQQKETIREPGIVGAQWWNDGLTAMGDPVSRRSALKSLAVLGASVAVGGFILSRCGSGDDEQLEYFDALDMQRQRGWDFGAADQQLTFPGKEKPDASFNALEQLVTELTPRQDALKPYYQGTLFQSVAQEPPSVPGEPATSLRQSLWPIDTPEMETAWQQGDALEDLFEREGETTTAVMVDLPGPESVAFSAALARYCEPVFTFDNWPHPMGVVPAHLTLAAVTHYRDTFRRLAQERRSPAPPVFVLDRNRLAPFSNPESQFDNRYVARLPPSERLLALGLKRVLYVVPGGGTPQELDDLNDDFAEYRGAGIDVKLVAANDFRLVSAPVASTPSLADGGTSPGSVQLASGTSSGDAGAGTTAVAGTSGVAGASGVAGTSLAAGTSPDGGTSADGGTALAGGVPPAPQRPRYYFGGSPLAHASFWTLYGWQRNPGPRPDPHVTAFSTSGGHQYVPHPRSTMFTGHPSPSATNTQRPRFGNFGMVMMRVASASRAILGPGFGPYGSWHRSSGSSYSFGG